jgi:small subunit ribosomal protein S17
MTQTCVVKVDIFQKHPRYKKFFVLSKKVKVDNPNSIYKTGDKVIIEETRPISKTKC